MSGRAFVFGDNIDTDVLAPGPLMKLPPDQLAAHCLSAIAPAFAAMVRPGDFVVAGRNFGMGSSREQAAVSLKLLGVGAVLAQSFARIFWRNALNLGLPVLSLPAGANIGEGDVLEVDPGLGRIQNLTSRENFHAKPLPPHLIAMIADGGLVPHLARRFSAGAAGA